MKKSYSTFKFAVLLTVAMLLTCAGNVFANIPNVFIINNDGPGEGFNDPTPAAPVGGNPGTTKGAQRLFAFQFAANKWAQTLDSNQDVYVVAAFNPLAPNVLGSAGAWDVFSDFPGVGLHPGAEFPGTWYSSALADKRAGQDQDVVAPDINAQFSSNFNFYLGVDNNHGALLDLVAVLLHELGHGLGFQNFVSEQTGAELGNFTDGGRFYPLQPDIFERHMLDITTGKYWHQMTQSERQASGINSGKVVFDGATVTADVPLVLLPTPEVIGNSPPSVAKMYEFGTAAFGPQLPKMATPITGNVVRAVDPADVAGPATTDGCSPFSNAAAISGNIALVERGTCGFAVKARNATNAGAIAVIIYNNAANAAAAPINMADDGINGQFVTIPAVLIRRADGLGFDAVTPTGNATLRRNPAILAGADPAGRARIFMPNPVQGGSSGSHYDSIAFPNLLMEPAINGDLTHELTAPNDLTLELMRDIGWFADADTDGEADATDCEPHSDLSPTVVIAGCNTGVPNIMFSAAPNRGCTLADRIAHIAATAKNHGQFVSGATQLLNDLRKAGTLTQAQRDAIHACVNSAAIP